MLNLPTTWRIIISRSAGRFTFIKLLLDKAIEKGTDKEVLDTVKSAFASPQTCEMCIHAGWNNNRPFCEKCPVTNFGEKLEYSCIAPPKEPIVPMQKFLQALHDNDIKKARQEVDAVIRQLVTAMHSPVIRDFSDFMQETT